MTNSPAFSIDDDYEDNNNADTDQISGNDVEFFESKHQQALNIATVAQSWIVSIRHHKYTDAILQDIDEHCTNALTLASKLEPSEYTGSQCDPEETSSAEQILEKLSIRHKELKDIVEMIIGK